MAQTKLKQNKADDPYAFDSSPAPQAAGGTTKSAAPRLKGRAFNAELDVCELDDRLRPGPTWAGKARELNRSRLAFVSRRMCYPDRMVLIVVHLIDDKPVPLFGKVVTCEYDTDGMYRVDLDLAAIPEGRHARDWIAMQSRT